MDDGLFVVQHCCYLPGLRCYSLYPYRNRCRIDFRLDFRCGIPYEILCREEGLVVLTTIVESEKMLESLEFWLLHTIKYNLYSYHTAFCLSYIYKRYLQPKLLTFCKMSGGFFYG